MILDLLEELGAWAWWIAGVLLLALEILLPGNVFVWFGIAAILTGVVALFGDLSWQIDLLIFAVLSLVLVIVGRRYFARRSESDEPHLNMRLDSMVGRSYVLPEPIVDGVGRIRINDANWRVKGPDLPSGTRVKVIGHDGAMLSVGRDED
ncbi:MAG: NfeD family protein [Bauldia sp.]|uniref:NfeD family protein n=1 Tax=Bauldia sp. TaxID=2575872 RepID=UPI001E0335C8|nr:NfeD family protein [Bauldia sp.]MCB1496532.1 NfeD family protein [Bauldia sp.]